MSIGLNIRTKIVNLLNEIIRGVLCYHGVERELFNRAQQAWIVKEKLDKLGIIKIKNVFF